MNLKKQLTLALFISLLCAIGFGMIAVLVSDKKIAQFDSTIIAGIQGLESPWLTSIMKFFTFIGSGTPVAVIALLVLFFLYKVLHHRRELILFIWVVLGTTFLNEILKTIFHRARPTLHRIVEANGYSFPSGHSMSAFSLYGVIAFLLWRHLSTSISRGLLILFSIFMMIMIGVSRIYLGVHYPSDVLGGFLASGCLLAVSIWFYQRYMEKRSKSK
jgi:undecaprenyl-diphosphatase